MNTVAVVAVAMFATACGGNTSFAEADAGTGGTGGATGGTGGAAGGTGGAAGGTGGAAGAGGSTCGPAARTCSLNSDCTLTAANCCICGEAELSDYVAVNTAHTGECGCQGPACRCAITLNPNLGATCGSGTCTGFDVRQVDALSACKTDSDCMLRVGADCCEGCQATDYNLVAIRTDAATALREMVCDPTGGVCGGCLPAMPPDKRAACVNGRCQVVSQ